MANWEIYLKTAPSDDGSKYRNLENTISGSYSIK